MTDSITERTRSPKSGTARFPRRTPPRARARAGIGATALSPEPAKRPGGKLGLILERLESDKGASIDELVGATGWQKHTVHGALSRLRARGFAIRKSQSDIHAAIEPLIEDVNAQREIVYHAPELAGHWPDLVPAEKHRILQRLVGQAHRYHNMVVRNQGRPLSELARDAGVGSSYFTRILRLGFLDPAIVTAILRGRHPVALYAKGLAGDTLLPIAWEEQRAKFGIV